MARRRAISLAARVRETMKPFRSAKLAMQAIERRGAHPFL